MTTRVVVACGLDLLHPGHAEHLEEAAKLGDELVILIARDNTYLDKGGFCLLPFKMRMELGERLGKWLAAFAGISVKVMGVMDTDGTCARTIRYLKPDILAKGGDRDGPSNMPQAELDACKDVGCEIRYGVGRVRGSRSKLFFTAMKTWMQRKWNEGNGGHSVS